MNGEDRPGWFAVIYADGKHDLVGSIRRSKRLHWTQREARKELEHWADELGIKPVAWDLVDDDVIIGRSPGHVFVVSSIRLPSEGPTPQGSAAVPDDAPAMIDDHASSRRRQTATLIRRRTLPGRHSPSRPG